jgi:F5/8 type C domain
MVWRKAQPISVTASANDAFNQAHMVTDSKLQTRWSALGRGQWIKLDYGMIFRVHVVDVAWHRGSERKNRFYVEVSEDGVDWTPVVGDPANPKISSGQTQDPERYNIRDQLVRYVRVTGLGATYNDGITADTDWTAISEVMVYYDDFNAPEDADQIVLEIAPVQVVRGTDSRINISGHFLLRGSRVVVDAYAIDLTNAQGDSLLRRIAQGFRSAEFSATLATRELEVGQYAIRVSTPPSA